MSAPILPSFAHDVQAVPKPPVSPSLASTTSPLLNQVPSPVDGDLFPMEDHEHMASNPPLDLYMVADDHVEEYDGDREQVNIMEMLGLQHLLAMLEKPDLFEQIAVDDWEDEMDADEADLADATEEDVLDIDDVQVATTKEQSSAPMSQLASSATEPIPGSLCPFLHDYDPHGENTPDPFEHELTLTQLPPTPADVHSHHAVHIIYLLVVWLHTQFHLAFQACNAILVILALAFQSMGIVIDPPMYHTLPTLLDHLNIEPPFDILPVCSRCQEVHPSTVPGDQKCIVCTHVLFNTSPTAGEERRGRTSCKRPKPLLQFPTKSLAEQLGTMLMVPGIEDEIAASLEKVHHHVPGMYTNIFDGRVFRELEAHDGSKFFSPSQEAIATGELRIGITLGVDWWVLFSYLRSLIAPLHTSGPMSYSIINLSPHLRYRTANLLLAGILPGPKEANYDQVQHYLHVLINELIRLWWDGVVLKTPKFPQGRLVRVALVALVCDKPAAHKLAGFRLHGHTHFCMKCWIKQADKSTPAAYEKNAFRARCNAEQRCLQHEYLNCKTKKACNDFAAAKATQWMELFRLPYFDICEMVVIDPMHNLFLGVVKTHFYHIWVQQNILRKTKELRALYAILAELRMPAKLGRLPSLIGEPAGGSLTADQWMLFATIVAPLAIPQIWTDYSSHQETSEAMSLCRTAQIAEALEAKRQAAAEACHQRQSEPTTSTPSERPHHNHRPTARATAQDIDPDEDNSIDDGAQDAPDDHDYGTRPCKRPKAGLSVAEEEELDCHRPSNLHRDDPANFLKLCLALRILVKKKITDSELEQANTHI
ncbi:hypothetical protein ARMSODRAFT_1019655 [Armillaria solidipes]|uniref:Transposase domain-containing protein n=1 Tax=Armillaria solidipes TaxID=1076256 RepID=A0A2H3BCC5_9AGAR|nr:hypothetical protein ARMSODRAFT_1019655 [Armillaria solidipes]